MTLRLDFDSEFVHESWYDKQDTRTKLIGMCLYTLHWNGV
jgi:hypothetical protein